jgi:hypothetical protein
VKTAPIVRQFDASEMTMIYFLMIFGVQRSFPSIYNNRMTVNPVVIYVSSALMKDVVVSSRHYRSIEREQVEEMYTLEGSDSIRENDSELSPSEAEFRVITYHTNSLDIPETPGTSIIPSGDGKGESELKEVTVVKKSYEPTEVPKYQYNV